MTTRFTYISRGEVSTRPDGFDAKLNELALGRHYSDSLAFGYCEDIAGYCEVDNSPLFVDVPVDLWGFTIWRTVYTLGSDAKFARALDLINQWVERECFEQAKRTHTDDGVETLNHRAAREVWKRYDNIVIKDRSLEGASPDAVRQRFAAWTKEKGVGWSQQSSRHRFCILIDEEVLETLSSWFPPPPSWAGLTEQQQCSVKVIDVEIEGDDDDCYPHGYRCCLMTPPWMLAHIYHFSHNIGSDKMRDDIRGVPVYGFAKQWLSW